MGFETWRLVLGLGIGMSLGMVYFWGLWVTTVRLPRTRHPMLWVSGSFVLRAALSLGCFYVALVLGWEKLLLSVLGFWLMREIWRLYNLFLLPADPKKGSTQRI